MKPEPMRGFACIHGEGKEAELQALRDEVCQALECEPEGLVTAVIYHLHWDLDVLIDGIPCDMWAAIRSEHRGPLNPDDPDTDWDIDARAYIECDRIEDGFALTWKTWKEWADNR